LNDVVERRMAVSPENLIILAEVFCVVAVLVFMGKVPLKYNLRNLTVRWRTTMLTALAFTLVVGLLTVMLAFVNGMTQLTKQSGRPDNVLILSEGSTDEVFSNLGYGDTGDIERQPGVARTDGGEPLASPETYVIVNQPIPVKPGERSRRRFIQIRGIEDPVMAGRVHELGLAPGGSWFSQAGVQSAPGSLDDRNATQVIQAVVGTGIAVEIGRDLGKASLAVGDIFDLGPRKWLVVGLLSADGSAFGSEIWAKREIIGPMFGKENYTSITVKAEDADTAAALATYYSNVYSASALKAITETEYFASLSATNKQFLYAINFVAAIMAVGGVFGVMNTMFATVAQRTRDIGVLRILGYARWQILLSFLTEALLLAFIGGVLGCLVGCLADGWTATSILSGGQGGGKFVVLRMFVDAETLAFGLVFSLVMGAIGGLLPALSAMRLRPLESLR
ncbi:MAG: ABC transporter permease, partial [Planctomycetia bacterium]